MSKIDFQIVEENSPRVPTPPPAFDSSDILRMIEGGIEFINLTEKMVTNSSDVFTNLFL